MLRIVRRWGLRASGVVVTGVGLYVVAPSLAGLLDAWPRLENVRPRWFVVLAVLEVASFVALWWLTRIALTQPARPRARWRDVASAQLAGNAASRVLPGGAATGSVVQGRMLLAGGHPAALVTSALAAVGVLTTGVLLTLPVLTVPAVLIGPPPARQLQLGLVVSLLLAVVIVGLGVTVLTLPRLLAGIGLAVGGLVHKVHRRVTAAGTALALSRQRARVAAAFRGNWWRSVMAASAHRMLDYAALVAAVVAVGGQARPSMVLLAYVVAAALAMVPLTPGGLGFVETGLTGTLVLAGVGADTAVVATLLYRLASFWMPIPLGALAWAVWTTHRRIGPARRSPAQVPDP